MLTNKDLQHIVTEYLQNEISFDDFTDRYRRVSRGKFGTNPQVLEACLKIDAVLSQVYFDGMTENQFRVGLALTIY